MPLLFDRTVGARRRTTRSRSRSASSSSRSSPSARCSRGARPRAPSCAGSWSCRWSTAALSVPLWLLLGFQSNVWGFIGLVVCGFAFGAVLQFVVNAARRAAGPGKAWTAGLRRALFGSRTRSGGVPRPPRHGAHRRRPAGLDASTRPRARRWSRRKPATRTRSLLTDDGKYLLEFTGTRSESGPQQSQRTYADFDVFTDGGSTKIGTVEPHTDIYPGERRRRARRDPRAARSRTCSSSPTSRSTRSRRRSPCASSSSRSSAGCGSARSCSASAPSCRCGRGCGRRRRSPTTRPPLAAARARPRPRPRPWTRQAAT